MLIDPNITHRYLNRGGNVVRLVRWGGALATMTHEKGDGSANYEVFVRDGHFHINPPGVENRLDVVAPIVNKVLETGDVCELGNGKRAGVIGITMGGVATLSVHDGTVIVYVSQLTGRRMYWVSGSTPKTTDDNDPWRVVRVVPNDLQIPSESYMTTLLPSGIEITAEKMRILAEGETAHPHAVKMIQYGIDAIDHESPAELWEFAGIDGEWESVKNDDGPVWAEYVNYRRKPTRAQQFAERFGVDEEKAQEMIDYLDGEQHV